jgi:hypothetical protein
LRRLFRAIGLMQKCLRVSVPAEQFTAIEIRCQRSGFREWSQAGQRSSPPHTAPGVPLTIQNLV